MTIKLKPCPCGGKAKFEPSRTSSNQYRVTCEKCGSHTLYKLSKENAADIWNNRQAENKTVKLIPVNEYMLRTCPICGGKPAIRHESYWFPYVSRRVQCTSCGFVTAKKKDNQTAVNAWNNL